MIYENNYIIQVFYILHNCVVNIFHIFSVTFLALKKQMPLSRYNFFFIIILRIVSGIEMYWVWIYIISHN